MRRQCWMIVLAGMMSYFNPERALGAPQREVSQSRGATLSPPPYVVILISCSGLVSFVLLLLACLCCKRGGVGFNEFDNAEGEECSGASSPPPEDSLSSCPSLPEVYTLPLRDRALCPAIQDKADTDSQCFRRHTLNYLQEIGNGWFGKVILAEVLCDCSSSQAVVKELRVSASPLEQRKSLQHPNILQCLGQCSESIPFLLVMEFCQLEDYYLTPDKLWIPLRWIAPELLEEFRGGLIVTDQTKTSNVWSLGVVIWELFEFGSQPHRHLSDEEVLTFVIRERQITLAQPRLKLSHADYWYEVMQSCWLPPSQRPSVAEIFLLLSSLMAAERGMARRSVGEEDEDEMEDEEEGGRGRRGESEESFERRWDSLRPPAFQAAASERQREREREREEGGCRGANGNSFPLLDPVGNTITPSSSELDDILTVTETSKGLNFEYFWEKAHGRRGYKPLPPPQPIPTANATHRHSLDTPTVVPVISARSPSLASEYYIRLEEHTPQDKSPAIWQEDAELLKEGATASKKSPMHLFLTEISNVNESTDTKSEEGSWDLESDLKGECQTGGRLDTEPQKNEMTREAFLKEIRDSAYFSDSDWEGEGVARRGGEGVNASRPSSSRSGDRGILMGIEEKTETEEEGEMEGEALRKEEEECDDERAKAKSETEEQLAAGELCYMIEENLGSDKQTDDRAREGLNEVSFRVGFNEHSDIESKGLELKAKELWNVMEDDEETVASTVRGELDCYRFQKGDLHLWPAENDQWASAETRNQEVELGTELFSGFGKEAWTDKEVLGHGFWGAEENDELAGSEPHPSILESGKDIINDERQGQADFSSGNEKYQQMLSMPTLAPEAMASRTLVSYGLDIQQEENVENPDLDIEGQETKEEFHSVEVENLENPAQHAVTSAQICYPTDKQNLSWPCSMGKNEDNALSQKLSLPSLAQCSLTSIPELLISEWKDLDEEPLEDFEKLEQLCCISGDEDTLGDIFLDNLELLESLKKTPEQRSRNLGETGVGKENSLTQERERRGDLKGQVEGIPESYLGGSNNMDQLLRSSLYKQPYSSQEMVLGPSSMVQSSEGDDKHRIEDSSVASPCHMSEKNKGQRSLSKMPTKNGLMMQVCEERLQYSLSENVKKNVLWGATVSDTAVIHPWGDPMTEGERQREKDSQGIDNKEKPQQAAQSVILDEPFVATAGSFSLTGQEPEITPPLDFGKGEKIEREVDEEGERLQVTLMKRRRKSKKKKELGEKHQQMSSAQALHPRALHPLVHLLFKMIQELPHPQRHLEQVTLWSPGRVMIFQPIPDCQGLIL
ncbi:hypothetical protein JZ751_008278 [Albula glossodonta]|uniref:Serine-threonine/tyrosine-protein kinase catalytic domain-containing protein n=1 Tax=Albula glossodonta TaxID=121402 RepID=A0A8T2N327_9TELE|nr:hypothetical protein JZ751_008278 [Albula glossodonta]